MQPNSNLSCKAFKESLNRDWDFMTESLKFQFYSIEFHTSSMHCGPFIYNFSLVPQLTELTIKPNQQTITESNNL